MGPRVVVLAWIAAEERTHGTKLAEELLVELEWMGVVRVVRPHGDRNKESDMSAETFKKLRQQI